MTSLLVDRATIDLNCDKILQRVSPSQIDLFELCPRRWYNANARGLREEMTPPAIRGTEVATLVERYYLHGEEPSGQYAALAQEAIKIYGPRRPSITAEEWVVMSTEPGLPIVRGRYDFFDHHPKASLTVQGFEDAGGVEVLGDTKCRSSFRYAKSADPKDGDDKYIGADQQLNTYANAIIEMLGLPRIGLLHAYSLTDARRPPQGKAVGIVVSAEQLLPRKRKSIESVRQMAEWAKARPDTADDLPANTLACSQFRPKGCPYRGLCGIDATQGSWAQTSNNETKENAMESRPGMTLMERMKAERDRLAAGGNGAPAPAAAAPAPAAAPATSNNPTDHELAVAKARAKVAAKLIKLDEGDQIFTKEGSDSGWIMRQGTPAELQALREGAAPPPAAPVPEQIRAPEAPPPAVEQQADAPPQEEKKRRGRPPKAETPATPPPAVVAAPTPSASAPAMTAVASRDLAPKGLVLYVDCMPTKGEQAVDYNEWLAPIADQAAKSLGLVDWRMDFANKSEGALAAGIRANVGTLPKAIYVSGYSKARSVFLECVAPLATAVVKGITG